MEEKDNFGQIAAKSFNVGDLVKWSKWNSEKDDWVFQYGIIIKITNEIKSNRLVSISRVLPIHNQNFELEFFTISLRLVSPTKICETIQ